MANDAPIPRPAPAQSIAEVLSRMQEISQLLPAVDGIACFNRLYFQTTQTVYAAVNAGGFQDLPFMQRLDVVFANRYFSALCAFASDARGAPRAWCALFEARHRDVASLQSALAGMNAHINFDLGQAVVDICAERNIAPDKGSPQHQDYMRINDLLARLEPQTKQWLETPMLAQIDHMMPAEATDAPAMWSIRKARDAAWDHAEVLWQLREHPGVTQSYLRALDGLVGLAGRGLLFA